MENLIAWYVKRDCSEGTSFDKLATAAYAMASVCKHKNYQPFGILQDITDRTRVRLVVWTLIGIRTEGPLTGWQKELLFMLRTTGDTLVKSGAFYSLDEYHASLKFAFDSKRFFTTELESIFDELFSLLKEKELEILAEKID